MRSRLQQKVTEQEEELKQVKEEMEKSGGKKEKSDDEEEVPMAQRKRFTRVEMARVLMERSLRVDGSSPRGALEYATKD